MPVATVDPSVQERFELKTAPPDGFVVLRPLTYGMKVGRRDKASRMTMRSDGQQSEGVIELESLQEQLVAFDFAYCVVDHNLTDSNGAQLNFANPMTFKSLDPRIGSEIERYINKLNDDEDVVMINDFPSPSTTSLTDVANDLLDGPGSASNVTTKVT